MHKHKLSEIEILRAFSFLAIVLQHTLACFIYSDNMDAGSALAAAFLLLTSRYGVPMFVFITGLVLFYNHGNEELEYGYFLKKRFNSVFVPYFLWTVIYFIWLSFLSGTPSAGSSSFLAQIGRHTIAGDAFYHLWFMVMILQYYLLFPWFIKLVLKTARRPVLLLGATFALYMAYIWSYNYLIPSIYSSIHSPLLKALVDYRDRLFLSWFLYFIMGAAAGLNITRIKDFIQRFSKTAGVAFAATFAYIFYRMALSAHGNDSGSWVINYQITLPLNLEMVFYLTVSLLFMYNIAFFISSRFSNFGRSIQTVGRYSLGGYFIHPLVLFYLNSFARAYLAAVNPIAQIIIVFGICSLSSILLCFIISKMSLPIGNALVGRIS